MKNMCRILRRKSGSNEMVDTVKSFYSLSDFHHRKTDWGEVEEWKFPLSRINCLSSPPFNFTCFLIPLGVWRGVTTGGSPSLPWQLSTYFLNHLTFSPTIDESIHSIGGLTYFLEERMFRIWAVVVILWQSPNISSDYFLWCSIFPLELGGVNF